jgi:hypothetical protein
MRECHSQRQYDFYSQRPLVVRFSQLELSSDAGILLARQAEEQVQVCQGLAECIQEWRKENKIKTLVDIGGGQGAFLAAILQANPHLNGIVYDLPHVIEGAKSDLENLNLQNRCQAIGASFLESVPEGGDAYILKNTLTNRDDEHAIQILKNCYRAMPHGGKLLMVQSVIAPGNQPDLGKFTDLEMLLVTTRGRERSAAEFQQVLNAAGFQLARILPTQCPSSLIEAIKP